MLVPVLIPQLALILGRAGFTVHALWWIALPVLVVWLLGFVFTAGGGVGERQWYRW
ncbi:hydrophobic protein [Streptomyces sp. FH025]|uniref:hydrophobic protein n=1 Tax=Streptomyces sp. FH025 TaxID=2815937 RepID=UPI001A9ED1D7|nr:hydrophobic protein [Streptomyces sp. FH025]MBO1413297.1 hydrophobic protein [Streptomyces sp. FH025]